MASTFPAYIAQGAELTKVYEFVPATGASEPFVPGSLVVVQVGESGEVELCGADPTLIAGIAEIDSASGALLTANGRVPVRALTDNVVVAMGSSTTPVQATHVGNSYGVTNSSGNWLLDISKTTTSSRARVVAVNEAKGIFFVVFHGNVLQFSNLSVATA